jgi:hypothetical protein
MAQLAQLARQGGQKDEAPAAQEEVRKTISVLGASSESHVFDAIFRPKACELVIRKRLQLIFRDPENAADEVNYDPWTRSKTGEPDETTRFVTRFQELTRRHWSSEATGLVLVPEDGCPSPPPCPSVRVRVEVVAAGSKDDPTPSEDVHQQVFVKKAKTTAPHTEAKVGAVSSTLTDTALQPRTQGKMTQIPAMHEVGHMLGLPHSGARAGDKRNEYGALGSDEEQDIMGQGMVVSALDYAPMVKAMNELAAPCKWKVSDLRSSGLSPAAIVGLLLGGGAVAGGIGGLIFAAATGAAAGLPLGIGALVGLGIGAAAALGYGLYKLIST